MKFTASIKGPDAKQGVTLEDIMALLRGNDRSRIQGDLLNHAAARRCTISVGWAEGFASISRFINVFYEKAHEEAPSQWRIVFPCTLEFDKPMHGGLVLDFHCENNKYPTYTGYSINT